MNQSSLPTITSDSIATHLFVSDTCSIRLDVFITQQIMGYSRAYFSHLIEKGQVRVNNKVANKSGIKLKPSDMVSVTFPPERTIEPSKLDSVNSNITIVLEHEHFLVINKPAGLLVHSPHEGHKEVTLVDWLLKTRPDVQAVGTKERPGIIHRLDRDTSGLMIIALTPHAHAQFAQIFQERTIQKTYLAIVQRHPAQEGIMTESIGRDPITKTKMKCATGFLLGKIRSAKTHYRVLEYFKDSALVEAQPVTGRTHQIRVHFAHHGYPLLADIVYGTPSKHINRQALHAHKLSFRFDNQEFNLQAPLPKDMEVLLSHLL